MIRRPPRSTQSRSSAASDVYKRQRMDCMDKRDCTLNQPTSPPVLRSSSLMAMVPVDMKVFNVFSLTSAWVIGVARASAAGWKAAGVAATGHVIPATVVKCL